MQRTDFLMKVMTGVLFIAIAAYIGLYIFNAVDKPLKTVVAVRSTLDESGRAEGYVVRSETVVTGGGSATLLVSEGEKVASGETLAVSYQGAAALERASEIRALQIDIKEAEAPTSTAGGAGEAVLELSRAVISGNLENLGELTAGIHKQVFTGSGQQDGGADLDTMKAQLAQLLSENAGTQTVTAPMGGIFTAVVDGFEGTTPDDLDNLRPSSLKALFSTPGGTGNDVLGKLMTDIKWYYAAVMDDDDVQRLTDKLKEKKTFSVHFVDTYSTALDMTVENIGPSENGQCVVVFSSKQEIPDIAAVRALTAQVEFDSVSGLAVPKEAVKTDPDGKPYIYLLTGLQAEKVFVDIRAEKGNNYIVCDGSENNTVLREGSVIIVRAKDLANGKVVLS
ncbi:HlyD family efflux transporter periplasmic adaptor subunit [Oscillospiraceae bacterium WX1]